MNRPDLDRPAALARLLEGYRPVGEIERRHRTRMLALLRAGGEPMSRHRFEPGHFTASAIVVGPSGSPLALIRHASLGRWLQPGGHIEPGDATPRAAALREAAEETGLHAFRPEESEPVPFDLDIHAIPERGDEPAHLHFDLRFLFRALGIPPLRPCGVREARWVSLDAVERLNSEPAMGRVLAKLRRRAAARTVDRAGEG